MHEMNDILEKVRQNRIDSYSIEMLNKMIDHLSSKKKLIQSKANELLDEIEIKLNNNDGNEIEDLKKKIYKLNEEYSNIEGEINKIESFRQKILLHNRLEVKLGGKTIVRIKEGFIMLLIIFVLGMLYYDLTHPYLSVETKNLFFWLDFICCIIFLANFYFEYRLAENKRWYWKNHFIDFITSIPLPDAQAIRFGRAFRLVRLTRLFRFARVIKLFRFLLFFSRGLNELAEIFNVKLMKKSFIYIIIFIILGAFLISYYEGSISSSVSTFSNSIWWSFTTLVTGGFADIYNPESSGGRVLTVLLVLAGMIIIGIFTATLTSIVVGENEEEKLNDLKRELNSRLTKIEKKIK